MTKQRYKTLRPIMNAWADGARIQYRTRLNPNAEWIDFCDIDEVEWSNDCEYRIKPEPREWWAAGYMLYTTREAAEKYKNVCCSNTKIGTEVVHVREVVE